MKGLSTQPRQISRNESVGGKHRQGKKNMHRKGVGTDDLISIKEEEEVVILEKTNDIKYNKNTTRSLPAPRSLAYGEKTI